MSGRRNDSIDIARGLGIILVVFGHTKGLPDELHRLVYSFHMPAFFALSGYLFNCDKASRNALSYLTEKFRRLIVPAWFIGATCGLLFSLKLVAHKITALAFIHLLLGTFVGFPRADGNFLTTPLWFLFCLFCVETIATGIVCTIRGRSRAIAMYIIGVTAIGFSTRLHFIPFDMHIALGALLYFGLGTAIRHSTGWTFEAPATSSLRRFAIVGTIILGWFACAHFTREPISMSDNFFGSYPFSIAQNLVTSFLGTLAFFLLATSLPRSDLLRWLGTHTVPILGFNYVVSAAVVHLLDYSNANVWWLSFVLQGVLLATLAWLLDRTGIIGDIANGRLASQRPVPAAPSRQSPT